MLLTMLPGFQWDEGNIDKNLIAHGVENWECEQVFFNEPLLVLDDPRHSAVERRWAAFGSTNGGTPPGCDFHAKREVDPGHLRQGYESEGEDVL